MYHIVTEGFEIEEKGGLTRQKMSSVMTNPEQPCCAFGFAIRLPQANLVKAG